MGLESASYINELVTTNPTGGDERSTADNHLRLIKSVLKTTFPNITGPVTATQSDLNASTTASVPADIGAVGDGVADDTAAVSAAIVNSRQLPPGTYLVTTITFAAGAQIIGSGSGKTTIKLKAGTNADVLVAASAYTWFGNTSAAGTNNWRIEGITIDGNSSNQSPADPNLCNGIAYYSTGHTLRDVVIKNIKGHGIRSEGPQYGESASEMSPLIQNVNVDTTGRHGWWNNGPHDIDATTVYVCDASQEANNTWCGIYNDTYGSGRFFNVHPWHRSTTTNRMKWGVSSNGGSEFIACHFEGGRGQLQHRGKGDRVIGANIYGHFGTTGTPLVSFENHENQHVGCYYNGTNGTSMYAVEFKSAAAGNQISGYFNGFNVNSPFLFTSDGGMNTIKGVGYCSAGGATTFGGTKAASTDIWYDQGGTVISVRPATPLGTSAAPGLFMYGDTDTGLAQTEGANTLTAIAGAVKALTLTNNGASFGGAPTAGYSVQVGKNLSGATYAAGLISLGQIQAGVTNRADYFVSFAGTNASATVPDIRHFNATQGTFGNTPTVQYGFFADAGLVGATNNYGFHSNIASGANRWNFYAAGTASNYLAGPLGIGQLDPTNWYGNNSPLVVAKSQNAETILGIGNPTSGASASTSIRMIGGTGNSFTVDRLNDNTGVPNYTHDMGSAVTYRAWLVNGSEKLRLDSSGNVLIKSAAGLGYGTGAGGAVTQATSKVTACTLNKPTGQITTAADALAAGTAATFLFNNSLIAATDTVVVSGYWGAVDPTNYRIESFVSSGGGQAAIRVTNVTGGSRSEALVINFSVVKGATA